MSGCAPKLLNTQLRLPPSFAFSKLAALGSIFAVLAGLTRPAVIQYAPMGTFAYGAQPMVLVFAAVTLLPCVAYAWSVGSSTRFGLLLWFVLGTVTFTKDFAYVRWPGQPIFVTDVLLAVLLLSLVALNPRLRFNFRTMTGKLLAAYLAAGAFTLIRSIHAGRPTALSVQGAAVAWYSLFLVVGYLSVTDRRKLISLGRVLFLGAALQTVAAVAYFVRRPQYGYGVHLTAGGIYITSVLAMLLVAMERRFLPRCWQYYSLALLLAIGVILSNARTDYLALVMMLGAALVFRRRGSRPGLGKLLGRLARITLVAAVALALLAATAPGYRFISSGLRIAYQGLFTPTRDPDAVWRLAAWATAVSEFLGHPLAGVGYGRDFRFDFSVGAKSYLQRVNTIPHNTFIQVLYQMGLIGIVPLTGLLFLFFFRAFKYLRSSSFEDTAFLLVVLLQIGLIVLGMFNGALDDPFYGSLFWLSLGAGLWLAREKRVRQSSAAKVIASAW